MIPNGRQIAAARTMVNLRRNELAERANISLPTLRRMEACDGAARALRNNVAAVVAVLETAGIVFSTDDSGETVRLRRNENISGHIARGVR